MAMNRPRELDMAARAPMPASAPSQRFEDAKKSSAQRDAQSVGAMAKAIVLQQLVITGAGTTSSVEKLGVSTSDSLAMAASAVRRGGNHLFLKRDARWTDIAFKDGMKVVKIKAFSPAYFKVLDAIPELRASFAVGEKVLVTGKHVAIEITDAGAEQLGDAELRSLKEQW